jgi:hypothetical protein
MVGLAKSAAPPPPKGPPPIEGVALPELRELIQTERAYVSDLDSLCDHFLKPLRELGGVLSKEDERAVFSNCETLRGINRELLRLLMEPKGKTPSGAAAAFQQMAPVSHVPGDESCGPPPPRGSH